MTSFVHGAPHREEAALGHLIAREKARQSACLSNQKQIGVALSLYIQDYDEMTPSAQTYGRWWTLDAPKAWPPSAR